MKDASKQRVNVTISAALLADAKQCGLNLSQSAEAGIAMALKKHLEEQWRIENAEGIAAHNARIDKHGTLLTPIWELRRDDHGKV